MIKHPPAHPDLVVATYNVQKGIGTDLRRDARRTERVISALGADIVAVQEGDRRFGNRAGVLDLAVLRASSGLVPVPVAAPLGALAHGWHGNLLLVRAAAVESVRGLHLPGAEPRGALIVDLDLAQFGPVRVIAVHLALLARARRAQARMLAEVRAGRRVCGAFYGHPGVFAVAPHQAIAQARAEGYEASMEPGISAEDCLYADLGLDPGATGCQHFEAGQFLTHRRRVDRGALLVLWQAGMAVSGREGRPLAMGAWQRLLTQRLLQDYPADHRVTLYEAATLAIARPRTEGVRLSGLGEAALRPQTTLVLPPCEALRPDREMLDLIAGMDGVAPSSAVSTSTA